MKRLQGYKVKNMTSSRGNVVPNQFKIMTPKGWYFQSYDSVIVYRSNDGKTYLDEKYWNYSRTTSKYRNDFLGQTTKEIETKIASKEYKLVDLNG